jgi:hypothetical protein
MVTTRISQFHYDVEEEQEQSEEEEEQEQSEEEQDTEYEKANEEKRPKERMEPDDASKRQRVGETRANVTKGEALVDLKRENIEKGFRSMIGADEKMAKWIAEKGELVTLENMMTNPKLGGGSSYMEMMIVDTKVKQPKAETGAGAKKGQMKYSTERMVKMMCLKVRGRKILECSLWLVILTCGVIVI